MNVTCVFLSECSSPRRPGRTHGHYNWTRRIVGITWQCNDIQDNPRLIAEPKLDVLERRRIREQVESEYPLIQRFLDENERPQRLWLGEDREPDGLCY